MHYCRSEVPPGSATCQPLGSCPAAGTPAGTSTLPETTAVEQCGCRLFLPADERQVAARLLLMTGTLRRPYEFGCRRHSPAYNRDHHIHLMNLTAFGALKTTRVVNFLNADQTVWKLGENWHAFRLAKIIASYIGFDLCVRGTTKAPSHDTCISRR
jgi:hypothetical protein